VTVRDTAKRVECAAHQYRPQGWRPGGRRRAMRCVGASLKQQSASKLNVCEPIRCACCHGLQNWDGWVDAPKRKPRRSKLADSSWELCNEPIWGVEVSETKYRSAKRRYTSARVNPDRNLVVSPSCVLPSRVRSTRKPSFGGWGCNLDAAQKWCRDNPKLRPNCDRGLCVLHVNCLGVQQLCVLASSVFWIYKNGRLCVSLVGGSQLVARPAAVCSRKAHGGGGRGRGPMQMQTAEEWSGE
jgi:hypothetical protein